MLMPPGSCQLPGYWPFCLLQLLLQVLRKHSRSGRCRSSSIPAPSASPGLVFKLLLAVHLGLQHAQQPCSRH